MADSAVILYLECLKVLIGQRDLNKKNYIKICKKCILNTQNSTHFVLVLTFCTSMKPLHGIISHCTCILV